MAMGLSRWKVITPSEFPWEQEAFDFIRSRLPDADPYLAWQGFNFISDTGSIYEVDVLILTPVGFFLVEVKSRPGVLTGDAASWTWKTDGQPFTVDNPLHLASSKSKKLAGLLKHQKPFREIRCPFLEPLIFCSASGLQVELPEHARTRLCIRDREASADREARPGIVAALTQGIIQGVDTSRTPRIDRATMGAVSRAMELAGIRQSERYRLITDYRLKGLLMEGPGWQDWEGVHVSLPDNRRRIRRYTLAAAASKEQRDTLLRAAKREYQILDNLSHRGILGVKGFTDNEFGPAIIFEHYPKAVRLDHYLAASGSKLGIDVRLSLLRQVAEATKYAHGKGVYHRSLSPQSILVVDPSDPTPEIKIFNWQTASRDLATSTSSPGGKAVTATVHIENLVEDASTAYMAPEAMIEHDGSGDHLDVFSLGTLAYHLFAGRPPAASFIELHQKIRQGEGLQISAAMDGAPDALQTLIQFATYPDVTSRFGSVEEFLQQLEEVENQYTAPEQEETVNPLGARIKDKLEGGLTVLSRLGSGSTSEVLLVDDHGQERVLKVARSPEYNARLKEEAEVLQKLRHQYVVEVHGTVQMHGLTGILMQRAGNETLAKRIREEGKLHPDMLQRFGEDLLATVDWLEQKGIPHRDIKPDNIGVMPVGRGDQLHLVLFDFSLSRTPPEKIMAGTARYMDPFLTLRRPPRWDSAAERWSAAVTLYEMATGDLPKWGDGRSDPASLNCEISIDGDQFLPEVREGLGEFFKRAFRRDPAQRYDNCPDMLKAWRDVFDDPARERSREDEQPLVDLDKAIAAATLDTQVVTLGLPTRVMTALDRMGTNTIRDLLKIPLRRVYRLRGVGTKTRRHLAEAVQKLRKRFPDVEPDTAIEPTPTTTTEGDDHQTPVWSVDRLITTITGGAPAKKADVELKALRAFLNLDRLDTPARGHWPTQTEVAAQLKISKAKLNQWLDAARKRWLKNPSLTAVRDELQKTLDGHGGVMTAVELTVSILATRGSMHEEPQRSRLASAVVRAAVEAERGLAQPRLSTRRRGTLNLVARAYDEDDPTALCDYAIRLGDEADKLAAAEPLATPQRAIETLRRVKNPDKSPYADDSRMLDLAAAASQSAAVSGRLEIYPRNMPAARAIKLGLGAISGVRELKLDLIRDRVHGRYPEAEPLPGRPALDDLLRDAGWMLKWDDARQAFLPPGSSVATSTVTSTLPRFPTTDALPQATPDILAAREFEDRLKHARSHGRFLALSVAPRHLRRAAGDLADRFGLDVRSLDELLIREMQAQAATRNVNWAVVLKTDADGPAGRDWARLMVLARSAADTVEKQILAFERPVLLMHAGLIARYDQLQFLEHLRDTCGRQGFVPGVWLLLAADRQTTLPTIDNKPVPVLGHGQWAWIPEGWLENVHRSNGVGNGLGASVGRSAQSGIER